MFENRSLKIQVVRDDKSHTEFRPYINQSIDFNDITQKITKSLIKVIVVYVSADTLRKVVVITAKAKL